MKDRTSEKKIRWSIPHAMACVCEALKGCKLKVKSTKKYADAMERLRGLYGLSKTQIWVLCLTCENYMDNGATSIISSLAQIMDVPTLLIISWKKDVEALIEKGFLKWRRRANEDFMLAPYFHDSLCNNAAFVSRNEREVDETEFLNLFAERYESRRDEDRNSYLIQLELSKYEEKYSHLEMVKRAISQIKEQDNRFIFYDVANDLLQGGESSLNDTVSDLYDGSKRYSVASEMMEETHELFKKGFLEFSKKGNITDASMTLSDKGKKLAFGDKAFLFEDSINDKNLIKADDIKEKKLFYSEENQKEIDRLKNALQEDRLKKIQQRLHDDNLPVGVAVLLYGAPGTGKTESVMQIAKETGRSIVHVDISEVKSAWFGDSEKCIKKIFTGYKNACDIAVKKGQKMPILLFNEADALISKRKDSNAGNCAQTENAMQNILLEELENIKGIFIATTNLASNMDSAFERRFLFKIKFENPSIQAKTCIWMSKLSWLDKSSAEKFAKDYDFSGGQIDNIVRKIAMNEVISGVRPTLSEIHEMCRSEKIENPNSARRIGFGQ